MSLSKTVCLLSTHAGTYEGARAAAGSNTAFNLATRDSLGGSTYTNDNDAYGPTAGRPNVVKNGDGRSVAFTDLPPNSAAHSGSGYGVVAAAAGGIRTLQHSNAVGCSPDRGTWCRSVCCASC